MRKWSTRSTGVRDTLDPRLQQVMDFILATVADISLISGHRGKDEQDALVAEGKSKLRYPHSKHNSSPSLAVDFQPYPYPENETELWAALAYVAGAARVYAFANGWRLRWGGDWDQDGDLTDNRFDDLFHLELVDEL